MPTLNPPRRKAPHFGYVALFLLLILLAAGSAGVGVRNATHQSQDFQWSGARLLDHHVDPWQVYLDGDRGHQLIASQIPNYLPVLYLILAPLGLLSSASANLIWALCNLTFAVASGWLAGRFYGLRGRGIATLICLFLMATPTRMSIGNGQQSLLVLVVWCLTLLSLQTRATGAADAAISGIGYAKFSFAPPVFLYLLFRSGPWKALLSLIPAAAGALLAWLWLGGIHSAGSFVRIAKEPFAVAGTGFRWVNDDQNLMNIVHATFGSMSEQSRIALGLGLALAVCAVISFYAFRVHRDADVRWHLALMGTMSFALFNHHAYDGVVLLLPLAYALTRWRERAAQAICAVLAYLFYFQRIFEAAHLHPAWAKFIEFGMLLSVLGFTYRLRGSAAAATTAALPQREAEEVALAG